MVKVNPRYFSLVVEGLHVSIIQQLNYLSIIELRFDGIITESQIRKRRLSESSSAPNSQIYQNISFSNNKGTGKWLTVVL